MGQKTKTVLVGAAGFGNHYMEMLLEKVDPELFELTAIVDPFVERAPRYRQIVELKIPVYKTLEEFYQKNTADLVLIVSPFKYHKQQSITAMEHGSDVLCEKPLVTDIDDIPEIEETVRRTGRHLAVGFQWSFSPALLRLKKDIIDGVFGKPVLFQSFTIYSRYDRYYARTNWAGKLYDTAGDLVMDSIATNATAHFLHNIFFMLGKDIPSSAVPEKVEASLYRANPIETFDTCFLSGEFADGCRFQYVSSHCSTFNRTPILRYELEKAVITYDSNEKDPQIQAHFHDGRVVNYGHPDATTAGFDEKLYFMLTRQQQEHPVPCTPRTVLPHLTVCDALFDRVPVHPFPQELIYRGDEVNGGQGNFVKELYSQMRLCFDKNCSPYEAGFSWAFPSEKADISHYSHLELPRHRPQEV